MIKQYLRRGLRPIHRQVGIRYNRVESRLFDLRHGVDTAGKIPIKGLGFGGEVLEHSNGFQSVNQLHFDKVIDELDPPRDEVFIDIGCGKGKALLLAARRGFERSIGVEISEELCEIARRNASRWPSGSAIRVVAQDAREYEFTDESVVMLNDPFDTAFMSVMLERLHRSLLARPRRAWLLYFNPNWMSAIDESVWRPTHYFQFFGPGRNAAAYTYMPTESM